MSCDFQGNAYQGELVKIHLTMKILIEIFREGRFFIARDLLTKIADQGLSENEAVQNLKKGLGDHYRILIEMNPPGHQLSWLDIEVDNLVRNPSSVIS